MLQAERRRLRPQVGILPAGNLVIIDLGRAGLQPRLEGIIEFAHILPVVGIFVELLQVDRLLPLVPLHHRDDGVEVRLRGQPRHRRQRAVDDIDIVLDRLHQRRRLDRRGIVGVQMDRDIDRLAQRRYQLFRGIGFQQPRHVLDAEHVRAGILQPPCEIEIILQVVAIARLFPQHVAGIADGRLGDAAGMLAHRLDRLAHPFDPVQRIENAEHIDAVLPGAHDEALDEIVGIGLVADRVGAAKKHLEQDIGYRLAQHLQAQPRRLLEKAQRHVEGGATPHLQRKELEMILRQPLRHLEHVQRPHPRRQQ